MIEQKENDWVLNLLGNLNFSTADFAAVGLNAKNTSLLDESTYKQSLQILDNPEFKKEDGSFDDTKFHKFYENATLSYNLLANQSYIEDMRELQTKYGKDDIFAPIELRRKFKDTVIHTRTSNPDRTTTGLIRVGESTAPKWSTSELALTLKVLVNPTEVYDENGNPDWSKAKWHDAPNDSWFTDFFDTRVKAQWESDGEHEDPITGQLVKHKKGQYKLNENGTYYYENLDGRDIYGREVLNKMNTLTTDGSTWNKYDFFDSDDLELKSITGSIMKNLALVGSMFIPYVGPWVAGVSVASLLVGLSGTLGKMFLGSDSPTLSALEGWSKSVNRQTAKTDYANQNTWCWENFISLIGDVAGQLKEQRVLFEFAPALIKGDKTLGWNGIDTAKQTKMATDRAKYLDNLYTTKFLKLLEARNAAGKILTLEELKSFSTAKAATLLMGNNYVEDFMKSYNHIGEILSKGYMTAITVGDTYGEAKYEGGASDLEATLLTLGYAAGEAVILNTGLGEWILPELKASGLKNKAIVKALTEVPEEMRLTSKNLANITSDELKKKSVRYWFLKGKELAEKISEQGKGLAGQMISGGLGEGFEEVTEELLADFSKQCYNTVQWLAGNDNKRMSAWDNMLDRYLMSFLGGAVGGSLTAAGTNFKTNNTSLTSELATQELVYMLRLGKKNDLFKSLNKMNIANPYLLYNTEKSSDGSVIFKPANSSTSNMDKDIKKAFINLVNMLDDIIHADGLKITDNEFLNTLTFRDIRLANLLQSSISSLYLLDFNKLCQDIIATRNQLNVLGQTKSDTDKEISAANLTAINNKTIELNELIKRKDAYLNGELAMDYISASLFDLTPMMSRYFTTPFFKDYAENKYKRKFNTLTESEIKTAREEFDNWKATDYKNNIATLAPLYLNMARNSGLFILEHAKNYSELRKNLTLEQLIKNNNAKNAELNELVNPETNEVTLQFLDEWLDMLSSKYKSETFDTAKTLLLSNGSSNTLNKVKILSTQLNTIDPTDPLKDLKQLYILGNISNIINSDIANNVDTYFDDFINTGVINPEIKNQLSNVLISTKEWTDNVNKKVREFINSGYLNNLQNLVQDLLLEILINENTPIEEIYQLLEDIDPDYVYEYFNDNIENTIGLINETASLLNMLKPTYSLKDVMNMTELLEILSNNINIKLNQLNKVTYTDSIKFIQLFILDNSDSKLNMPKLLPIVNDIINLNVQNLENINLDALIDHINEGIEVIGWLQGLVAGAQVDSDAALDNLIGYNVTLNEIAKKNHVPEWEPLPLINSEDALIINLDLELTKNKLILAKNIYYINLGKKLNLQSKASINKSFITYNRLKKFIINIDDSWAEKSKLEETLDKANTIKKYSEQRDQSSLTDTDKKNILKENTEIDHAIYEFFQTNKDIIDKGDLYTLFMNKDFDLYSDTDLYINENTDNLEDRNFLYYLASRAAIDRSKFNNEFRQIIDPESEHILAPISTLEEAVFLNMAELLNGDMTTAFMLAFRKAAIDDFNNHDEAGKRDILLKRFGKNKAALDEIINGNEFVNFDYLPVFTNIYLTEGKPGTGKSDAVNVYTAMLINKFHKDTLGKNVWVAHDKITKAEKLGKKLGFENSKYLDKNKLMTSIYSKYNTNRKINSRGLYIYDKSELIRTSDNIITIAAQSDDLAPENIPSLIIIDEVSHYDLADLLLLNDFAKKYGISIITSGDFDQSSASALGELEGSQITMTPIRSHFKHSPRLGISMRTTNSQMDKTITAFQEWRQDENRSTNLLNFYHYTNPEIGLNGVKHLNGRNKQEIKEVIELLINSLKPNEDGTIDKIGLIYDNANSITNLVVDEFFADKVEKFLGTAALGLEGLYYIVDLEGSNQGDKDMNHIILDLYTGITRAKLGALVISTIAGINMTNNKEDITTNSSFSEIGLRNYAKNTKLNLDEINSTDEILSYIPRTKTISLLQIANPTASAASAAATVLPTVNPPQISQPNSTAQLASLSGLTPLPNPSSLTNNGSLNGTNSGSLNANLGNTNSGSNTLSGTLTPSNQTNLPGSTNNTSNNLSSGTTASTGTPSGGILGQKIEDIWQSSVNLMDISLGGKEYITNGSIVAQYTDTLKTLAIILDPNDPINAQVLTIYNNQLLELFENTNAFETNGNTLGNNVNLSNLNESKRPPVKIDSDLQGYINNFTYLLHSHNTFELGIIDNNNKISFPSPELNRYEYRIDSAIGLMKIYEQDWTNPTRPVSFYKNIINDMRNYIFNVGDKTRLLKMLSLLLQPGDDNYVTNIEFGLISSPNISKNNTNNNMPKWGYFKYPGRYGVLDKCEEERTINNLNPDPDASQLNRKSFAMTLKTANGKRVAIPLFVLGNLETYTKDTSNPISARLKILYDLFGKGYEFCNAILKDNVAISGTTTLKDIPQIANLAKLFIFDLGGYFKIDDPTWTPAKNLNNWGLQINTESNSGDFIPYDGKNTFMPIKNLVNKNICNISKLIYCSLQPVSDANNNFYEFANKGHAFVLLSTDPFLNNDEKMRDLYIKQLLNPKEPKKVTRVYVMPPKVGVDKYLRNLHEIIYNVGSDDIIKLGSHISSYNIWKALLPELKANNPNFVLGPNTKTKLISEIERLINIENSISDPKQRTDALVLQLMADSDWGNDAPGKAVTSLLNHFNYMLVQMFTDLSNGIIEDKLDNITKLIESNGITELFYSTKFKNTVPDSNLVLVPLQSDQDLDGNSLYTIDGLDFSINAKIDSNLFSADSSFDTIIAEFISKISNNRNGMPISTDTYSYVNDVLVNNITPNEQVFKLDMEINGVTEFKYYINKDNHYVINGKEIKVPSESIELYTLNDFRSFIDIKVFDTLGRKIQTDLAVVEAYEKYTLFLLLGNYVSKNDVLLNVLKNWVNIINIGSSEFLAFYNNGKVLVHQFSKEQLELLGLETISLNTDFSDLVSDVDNSFKMDLGDGYITVDMNNDTVVVTKPVPETKTDSTNSTTLDFDNMNINTIMDIFNSYKIDIPKRMQRNPEASLSNFKNNKNVLKLLLDIVNNALSNEDVEYIKDLIKYLNTDNNFNCSINK